MCIFACCILVICIDYKALVLVRETFRVACMSASSVTDCEGMQTLHRRKQIEFVIIVGSKWGRWTGGEEYMEETVGKHMR